MLSFTQLATATPSVLLRTSVDSGVRELCLSRVWAQPRSGFPNQLEHGRINWSMDGKSVFVSLQYFGLGTAKTVVLPYRSGVPLAALWPKGLRYEQDVAENPGATVINEAKVFPAASAAAHLSWRRTTQSNLYRLRPPA